MEALKLTIGRKLVARIYIVSSIICLLWLAASCGGGHRAGIYHQVRPGDTIYKIAREYNVSALEIARANNIKDLSSDLREDAVLFIPGATKPKEVKEKKITPPPPPSPPRQEGQAGIKPVTPQEKKAVERRDERKAEASLPKGERRFFVWPFQGEVTETFGPQPGGMVFNHIRIDGKVNEPVLAAAEGTVIFSANLKDFGETVIIKHDRGFTTVYTHLGSRSVRVEEKVSQGKKIGTPHSTGKDGRGFIRFEIREHTKPLNPLQFLPPK